MKLFELLTALSDFATASVKDAEITGIVSDSRRVRPGNLFVCIPGLHEDGHRYIRDAVQAGAAAVVTEKDHPTADTGDVPQIAVSSARSALALLCSRFAGDPGRKMRLIAVTGTNGKTSVAFMIRAILESAMVRCGLIGTVNCYSGGKLLPKTARDPLANMTTPDPEDLYPILAQMAQDGVQTVIMEATSHALALRKLDALHFDAAIFTNLTPEHLDFHGDMEHYLAAKASLFDRCDLAILNRDDPYAKRLAGLAKGRVRYCSVRADEADYFADDVHFLGADGVAYALVGKDTRMKVRCSVPGMFSVINSLEAAALALEWGIAPPVIGGALSSMSGIDGRMERVKLPLSVGFSVFIDYAHTPDALENLLKSAREFCPKNQRLVVIFGCGGDRDKSKRPLMGSIAAQMADFVFVTSDNSRSESPGDIIGDILQGMEAYDNFAVIPDRRQAIFAAVESAGAGDIILLAGKGHETYEIDGEGRHPFDEKAIVKEAVARLLQNKQADGGAV